MRKILDQLYIIKHKIESNIAIEENGALDGSDDCATRLSHERLRQMRIHLSTVDSIIDTVLWTREAT